MTKHDDIKTRLIARRAELGWSQERLSKESGVAAAQISRYEAGLNKPRANIIAKLASAMTVEFGWLAYGIRDNPDLEETEVILPRKLKEELVKQAKAAGMTEEQFIIKLLEESFMHKKPT
ncbi:XRE family transcriptional regulator [Salmonella enterica subsp. enterica]|nr:XRE family transcriptional regulator [Salmonella enterica subsp. enterica serovar Miami]